MGGFLWSLALSLQFLFLYSLFSLTVINCVPSIQPMPCHGDESRALLQFKEGFVIRKFASDDPLSYPKTASWNASTDCCSSWDGIECDVHTGHVIGIHLNSSQLYGHLDSNSGLFGLAQLQTLDLADNHFNYSQIPYKIGELSKLRYLKFAATRFYGEVPHEVSHLSKLLFLDLRSYMELDSQDPINLLQMKTSTLRSLIQNSTSLETLRLNFVSIASPVPDTLTHLTSLQVLTLAHCELYGEFPARIFHLPNLTFIDLGFNQNLRGKFPDFHSSALISALRLASTSFYGTLPASIGKLSSLKALSVSKCSFFGSIPSSLGNLTQLTNLDLGFNTFSGDPSASLGKLTQLTYLDLGYNTFSGDPSASLKKLTQLTYLDLGSNTFSGDLSMSLTKLTQLTYLDLGSNTFSGDLSMSLTKLTQLTYLHLVYNTFSGDLSKSLTKLTQLKGLNLAYNNFRGDLSASLSNLTKLQKLSVGSNKFTTETILWVCKLSEISFLDLRFTNIGSDIPSCFVNLTQLSSVYLINANITGEVPSWIMNLTNLAFLDLDDNNLRGEIPDSLFKLENLEFLSLGNNLLKGKLELDKFRNLYKLYYLFLSDNKLTLVSGNKSSNATIASLEVVGLGACNLVEFPALLRDQDQLQFLYMPRNRVNSLPSWMWRKKNLKGLEVYYNSLTGKISPLICNLKFLVILDLSFNNLSGTIPSCLGSFSQSLRMLELQGNNFSGLIPQSFLIGSALILISLSKNNLQGQLPRALVNCTMLEYLDVSHNKINDSFPFWLGAIPELKVISLSNNQLHGSIGCPAACTFSKLHIIDLSHNKLSGSFPSEIIQNWKSMKISNMSQLQYDQNLAISGSKGWQVSYNYPYTMMNKGEVPSWIMNLTNLAFLDLDDNNLKGLDVSNNSLTGKISPLICNLKFLEFLGLSFNKLSGTIPSCLGSFSQSLRMLELQGNNFSGLIPQSFLIGSALILINLSKNNLQGQLPRALVNCTMLEYLDVSYNKINDSFPFWLGDLPELKVIALSNNQLHGSIGCPRACKFPKLHIINLSHNKLSGSLPSEIIQNWKSMKISNMSQLQYDQNFAISGSKGWQVSYNYSYTMMNKGVVTVYTNLQQVYNFIAVDISSNRICGQIPDVMGDLNGLYLLNLSNNLLVGNIPSSLGKLSNLEALDLSLNNLSGNIPQQLTELTFLEFFNVSFNNLSGPIPQNKQFSTFSDNSFEGNQGLCGNQLIVVKKCGDHARPSFAPPSASDGDEDSGSFFELDWKIVMIGYGGGLVAGVALGISYSAQVLRWLKRFF